MDEGFEGAAGETVINNTAVDLLRRLPGVGEGNYRSLMTAADSLAGLAAMTLKVVAHLRGLCFHRAVAGPGAE